MKATNGGIITCGRDAVTGQFIPTATAKKRKSKAIVQKIKVVRTKDGRFAAQLGKPSGARTARSRG